MDYMIYLQAAIDAADRADYTGLAVEDVKKVTDEVVKKLKQLSPAQPDNQVHLCESCRYTYPDCPSKDSGVIFGNGKGNDNICACNRYLPPAQPEPCEKIITMGEVLAYIDHMPEDVWQEFVACLECRGWSLERKIAKWCGSDFA